MIPIEKAHRLFDLWIDKTQSPYFSSQEKDLFLERAVIHYVTKFFNDKPSHLAERGIRDLEAISNLIFPVEANSDTRGRVLYSSLSTSLSDRDVMHIMNVRRSTSGECKKDMALAKFVRHNNFYRESGNTFKKAEEKYPTHKIFSDHVRMDPEGVRLIAMDVVVRPLAPTIDDPSNSGARGPNAVDIEIKDEYLNEIVYLALKQAGISIREQDLYQLSAAESVDNE